MANENCRSCAATYIRRQYCTASLLSFGDSVQSCHSKKIVEKIQIIAKFILTCDDKPCVEIVTRKWVTECLEMEKMTQEHKKTPVKQSQYRYLIRAKKAAFRRGEYVKKKSEVRNPKKNLTFRQSSKVLYPAVVDSTPPSGISNCDDVSGRAASTPEAAAAST